MDSSGRKRGAKACGRCKLRKTKCHGANPCDRRRRDNAICVFRCQKLVHQKGYPTQYVGLLEEQQMRLVFGLQEMYKRALSGQGWLGAPVSEASSGVPLTHDILERLGVIEHDTRSNTESSGSDKEDLPENSIDNGEGFLQAQDPPTDSDSDQAQDSILTTKTAPPALLSNLTANNPSPYIPSIQNSHYPQSIQREIPIKPCSTIIPDMVLQAMYPTAFGQQWWTDSTSEYDQSTELQGCFSPSSFGKYGWDHDNPWWIADASNGSSPPAPDWQDDGTSGIGHIIS